MKEKALSLPSIVLSAILVAWLAPGLTWFITDSDKAAFLTASITSALLGLVFLFLCLPLAGLMDRSQREMLGPLPKLFDLVVRHFLVYVGWPQSRRGWIITNIGLAGCFFVVAILAFFWATGDAQSEQTLTRWLEDLFHKLF